MGIRCSDVRQNSLVRQLRFLRSRIRCVSCLLTPDLVAKEFASRKVVLVNFMSSVYRSGRDVDACGCGMLVAQLVDTSSY